MEIIMQMPGGINIPFPLKSYLSIAKQRGSCYNLAHAKK